MRANLNNAPVSDWLLGYTNSGPGVQPCIARYWTNASTGQIAWVVLPRHIVVPALNWSFLDCLRVICMVVGDIQLSKATSDSRKSVEESKRSGYDMVNSLTLRSPKYVRQQAAQINVIFVITRVL